MGSAAGGGGSARLLCPLSCEARPSTLKLPPISLKIVFILSVALHQLLTWRLRQGQGVKEDTLGKYLLLQATF